MRPSNLTPQAFSEWKKRKGMSNGACAVALGVSRASISSYESGMRKEGKVIIPFTIALAISAINHGLTAYEGEDE